MLDEVVKEIKKAEEECKTMLSDAQDTARKLLRDADAECEEIAKNTAIEIKTTLAEERAAAEKTAQANYAERIKKSEAEAAELRKSKAELADAEATQVVKSVLSKYVSR